jgi:hypothetical protein
VLILATEASQWGLSVISCFSTSSSSYTEIYSTFVSAKIVPVYCRQGYRKRFSTDNAHRRCVPMETAGVKKGNRLGLRFETLDPGWCLSRDEWEFWIMFFDRSPVAFCRSMDGCLCPCRLRAMQMYRYTGVSLRSTPNKVTGSRTVCLLGSNMSLKP